MILRKSAWVRKRVFIGLVVSVVMGVTGFVFFRQPLLVEADLFIPIESDSTAWRATVVLPVSGGLNVRVRGPADAITGLSQAVLRYPLKNLGAKNDTHTIRVDFDKIRLPADVAIVHLHPETVTVRVERIVERKLPVRGVLTGTTAPNFSVANSIVQPDSILIKGPESILLALTQVRMKPVDINGLSKSLRRRVVPDLPEGTQAVTPGDFFLEVTVKEKIGIRRLDNVVINGKGGVGPFQIMPPTIGMTIKGPVRILQNLKNNPDFNVYIDLKGLGPGRYVRRAVIQLPLDTILVTAEPEIFTVHIGS